MKRVLCAVVAIIFLALACAGGAVAVQYQAIDLGTLVGSFDSYANGINDVGQVVGGAYVASYVGHAFMWENGVMQDLGVLAGNSSVAYGINNAGQIVGTSDYYRDWNHAFLWENGIMRDIGTDEGGEPRYRSEAYTINDAGQCVGYGWEIGMPMHGRACLSENGVMQDLNRGLDSFARGINNSGLVVGYTGGYEVSSALIWENGVLRNLGTLGGAESEAYAINDKGQIVGWADRATEPSHAFLWENGVMRDLGALSGGRSSARGINERGQIVGGSSLAEGGSHAVLWDGGVMQDLGTLGGISSYAYGINESGWIVGSSVTSTGESHACLWMPVPEPSSLAALLCGLAGLGGVVWRRRG